MNSLKLRIPLLIFDVNETLLDLRDLKVAVKTALNGDDDAVRLWFERTLHYSLVDSATESYHDFDRIGAACLRMLASERDLPLSEEDAMETMSLFRQSPPHKEVPDALEAFATFGYRMVALSNSSSNALHTQLTFAGIDSCFEQILSVESLKLYKPHRKVYLWAAKQMNTQPKNCLFIAAHAWDVAGAMAAGMQTAFIQRSGQSPYPLIPQTTYTEPDLLMLHNVLTS
ncbi:MAG: haloacid dehalogenase type II [Balneolaceae bacterium]